MRYEVKKLNETDYEFTHIEKKTEYSSGKEVEVVKGVNVITYKKLNPSIENLKKEIQDFKNMLSKKNIDDQIKDYKEMVSFELKTREDNLKVLNTFHNLMQGLDK